MTREELVKIIVLVRKVQDEFMDKVLDEDIVGYDDTDVAEEVLKRLGEPSLPAGLDEAAIRYAKLKEVPGEEERYYNQTGCNIYDAFKSGAEWMAGQGVTIERIVDDFGHGASIKPPTEMELDSIGAMLGDKVIVQIRKK